MKFSTHFTSRGVAESLTELADVGFSVRRWRFRPFRAWLRRRRRVVAQSGTRKCRARAQDVSGTAPPSCMKRAQRSWITEVLGDILADRAFEFAVDRAVFVSTLYRIFVSGSDRDCSSWMEDYDISGAEGLDLRHFYRAMAWLGEEMEEKSEDALAPRCVKEVIEEKLFDKRRDLFADLSAVFMDTTSLSFYGEVGETLGEHGYSKDYGPI